VRAFDRKGVTQVDYLRKELIVTSDDCHVRAKLLSAQQVRTTPREEKFGSRFLTDGQSVR